MTADLHQAHPNSAVFYGTLCYVCNRTDACSALAIG